ncbi:MAG TPA: 2-hydroxychromene-2-carboxylate isomerase [Burkholderiaceae bacterium]|nr:2-hydroxychromene-2-carboxylate isomerase [Burkholderiaceae bacterium]
MPAVVRYFMSPVSPWTYLGHDRFVDVARRHGATIELRPIDLGRVFPVSGGVPLAKRAPQRQAYRLRELPRWRDHLGVPLVVQPKHFPVPADDAARLIVAADLAAGTDAALRLAGALLRACWAEERDVSDAATLAAIAGACGLDAASLAARADEARAAFDAYTEEATATGVFGAPWYQVGDEPFWGQDRLDFVERALARAR